MQIERLVDMANQIGDFFGAEPDKVEAATATASHLRRFWDPRMRKQIIAHYQARGGGLNGVASAAVALLAQQK
jgi:formate dehydrogenase subunit delta